MLVVAVAAQSGDSGGEEFNYLTRAKKCVLTFLKLGREKRNVSVVVKLGQGKTTPGT